METPISLWLVGGYSLLMLLLGAAFCAFIMVPIMFRRHQRQRMVHRNTFIQRI